MSTNERLGASKSTYQSRKISPFYKKKRSTTKDSNSSNPRQRRSSPLLSPNLPAARWTCLVEDPAAPRRGTLRPEAIRPAPVHQQQLRSSPNGRSRTRSSNCYPRSSARTCPPSATRRTPSGRRPRLGTCRSENRSASSTVTGPTRTGTSRTMGSNWRRGWPTDASWGVTDTTTPRGS